MTSKEVRGESDCLDTNTIRRTSIRLIHLLRRRRRRTHPDAAIMADPRGRCTADRVVPATPRSPSTPTLPGPRKDLAARPLVVWFERKVSGGLAGDTNVLITQPCPTITADLLGEGGADEAMSSALPRCAPSLMATGAELDLDSSSPPLALHVGARSSGSGALNNAVSPSFRQPISWRCGSSLAALETGIHPR